MPVQVTLPARQTLWMAVHSSVQLEEHRIVVLKGCARLDAEGSYTIGEKSGAGGPCTAQGISREYETLRELRPLSQRP